MNSSEGDFLGRAPVQKSVNAAGAGDAVSSTFAWRLSLGDTWAEALRWSTAIGAASVLTLKTGDINIEDVNRIYREVEIQPLS
jgi:fructose-1-phosphate kinase PfkB-like protein